jgi:hypothetical protein
MLKKLLPIALLFVGLQAHAAPITIGDLSYDGTYITGGERTYLGFDTDTSNTYAQWVDAIGNDDKYEGFRIADLADMDYFIGLLFGDVDDSCSSAVGAGSGPTVCGTLTGWSSNSFGTTFNADDNYVWAIDGDNGAMATNLRINNTEVRRFRDHATKTGADSNAVATNNNAIGYLIVRDDSAPTPSAKQINVPVPNNITLLAIGLVGLGLARRRRS